MTRSFYKKISAYCVVAILLLSLVWLIQFDAKDPLVGVTYTPTRAEQLGLDPHETFKNLLSEVRPQVVRIPLFWKDFEPARGTYKFTDIDWYLGEARAQNVSVIMSLGYRAADSIDCGVPAWLATGNAVDREVAQRNLLIVATAHFKTFENIIAWQIEGDTYDAQPPSCGPWTSDALGHQIDIVKAQDKRPVLLVAGQNTSSLTIASVAADDVGVSIARSYVPPVYYYVQLRRAGLTQAQRLVGIVDGGVSPGDMVRQFSFMKALGPGIILLPNAEQWFAHTDKSWIVAARGLMKP